MSDYWIATFAGAVIGMFLLSRIFLLLFRKWRNNSGLKYIVVAALSFAVAVVVAGFGYANGGPWAGAEVVPIYGPAVIVVLLFDLIRTGTKPRPLKDISDEK